MRSNVFLVLLLGACGVQEADDAGFPVAGSIDPAGTVELGDMVAVTAGSYDMGSPGAEIGRDRDEQLHAVTLTRSFEMMATEVTQKQWSELMGTAPSAFAACDDCPVERINWYESLALANAASLADGLPACYELTGCENLPGEGMVCESVSVLSTDGHPASCAGYRLPTEAEWEYAARSAGAVTDAFPSGGNLVDTPVCEQPAMLDNGAELAEQAWYCNQVEDRTHAVGTLSPNALGLYDMAGNVFEWVWDGYAAYEDGVTDPAASIDLPERVFRGGDWATAGVDTRSANRDSMWPGYNSDCVGMRLVRTL